MPEKNRDRKHFIGCYLDDQEYEIFLKKFAAANCFKNHSSFLRSLIINGYILDCDYSFLNKYEYEINRIGNNINQIAKKINSGDSIFRSDIDELKELMKKIWQSHTSMLSKLP